MDCGKVIMQGESLYQRIVFLEMGLHLRCKLSKRPFAFLATDSATMLRSAKIDILIAPANFTWRAVIVIAVSHNATVYRANKFFVHRNIIGYCGDPLVCTNGGI